MKGRDCPRSWHRKTQSLTPLMGTPKSQLFTEQQLMKKAGTYHKRSFTAKDIKKAPQKNK